MIALAKIIMTLVGAAVVVAGSVALMRRAHRQQHVDLERWLKQRALKKFDDDGGYHG